MQRKLADELQLQLQEVQFDLPYHEKLNQDQSLLRWLNEFEQQDHLHALKEQQQLIRQYGKMYHC